MAIMHEIRARDGGTRTVPLTPQKAIRSFCVECMGFNASEVPDCTAPLCPIYPWRMGKVKTGRKGRQMGEAHRQALLEGRKRYQNKEKSEPETI